MKRTALSIHTRIEKKEGVIYQFHSDARPQEDIIWRASWVMDQGQRIRVKGDASHVAARAPPDVGGR